ncbi:hypothetical protein C9J40_20115 [Photobacterium sp. GB-72]|nr:hypothetical protein C9J40_20115 [Photobacterium sp. GB-72]
MGVVYIAFILATGFVFSQLHYPLKYRINRAEGWVAYFLTATVGFFFFASLFPFLLWFDMQGYGVEITKFLNIKWRHIKEWGFEVYQLKLLCWSFLSLSLSVFLGCLSTLIHIIFPSLVSWQTKRLLKSDALDSVIYENIMRNQKKKMGENLSYLSINLKSRKVYVGVCNSVSFEHGHISIIRLTPVLSGYRDADNLKLNFTTNYFDHYEKNEDISSTPEKVLEKFNITLFKDEIESISLFDPTYYSMFNQPQKSKVSSLRYC